MIATRAEILAKGVGITGDIGGLVKRKYWTPDGREILAVPSMRTYNRIKDKKVVESGVRDANLDKGWLLQPPTEPRLYCSCCDKWHDTQEEIDQCCAKKKAFNDRWEKKARAMKKNEGGGGEIEEIRKDIDDLKDMMKTVLETIRGAKSG